MNLKKHNLQTLLWRPAKIVSIQVIEIHFKSQYIKMKMHRNVKKSKIDLQNICIYALLSNSVRDMFRISYVLRNSMSCAQIKKRNSACWPAHSKSTA